MAQVKRRTVKKNTPGEDAYVRALRKKSAFQLLDDGEAAVLDFDQYPEPLRRFLRRERGMVHVKLSAAAKRKLAAQGRKLGISGDQLAQRWIGQRLRSGSGRKTAVNNGRRRYHKRPTTR